MGGKIILAHNGGLAIGRSHEQGGIKVIQYTGNDCYFIAEIQHGEYVMNPYATAKYMDRLKEINSFNEPTPMSPDMDKTYTYLHSEKPIDLFLFSSYDQFIINANATSKYLDELEEMNKYRG